jgi:type I restriction enzyme S subunit
MNVKQDKSGDGLPITRIETISNSSIDPQRVGFAGLEEADSKDWFLKHGDILFSHINSVEHIGKCAVYEGSPEKLVHGMNLLCLRPDSKQLIPEFAKYLIRGQDFRAKLGAYINKAVNQASVSIGNLKGIQVTIPDLEEQRRIAAILDKADALGTKRREALVQLDRLAQSIFVEMFGDLFTNSKGFPVSRLGDACDVRDGTHDSPAYVAEGYPLVTSKNLRDGKIDLSDVNFISETDYNVINRRSKVDIGDILMPMIGTIGNPVLVEEEPSFAIKNMALIKFKPNSPCREFVLQFLHSDCFDRLIVSKNKGGTQKFLALGEIRGLPLPVPSEASQVEFSKRIRAINRKRTRYEDALDGTEGLFASLQHRAFRGEL